MGLVTQGTSGGNFKVFFLSYLFKILFCCLLLVVSRKKDILILRGYIRVHFDIECLAFVSVFFSFFPCTLVADVPLVVNEPGSEALCPVPSKMRINMYINCNAECV